MIAVKVSQWQATRQSTPDHGAVQMGTDDGGQDEHRVTGGDDDQAVKEDVQKEDAAPQKEESQKEQEPAVADTAYILPTSNTENLSRAELERLSDQELHLARNEIYARRGRMFASSELEQYFRSKSWYTPPTSHEEFDAMGDTIFNQFEIANRNLIVEIERDRKG